MAARKRGATGWARGLSAMTDARVARQTATRRGQKRGPYGRFNGQARRVLTSGAEYLKEDQRDAYAYLLGLYLGDGYVVPSTSRLEISLDRKYPGLIDSCASAMKAVHPRGRANLRRTKGGCSGRQLLCRRVACSIPAPWRREEAPSQCSTAAMAGVHRERAHRRVPARTHPLGRLPLRQEGRWEDLPGVRLLQTSQQTSWSCASGRARGLGYGFGVPRVLSCRSHDEPTSRPSTSW